MTTHWLEDFNPEQFFDHENRGMFLDRYRFGKWELIARHAT